MPIPFAPEPTDQLRARLALALEPVYDPREIAKGGPTPGNDRRHVFDFEDGYRLIISRDLMPPEFDEPIVHVSSSFVMRLGFAPPRNFVGGTRAHWKDLGRTTELIFIGFTEGKGVPHFVED